MATSPSSPVRVEVTNPGGGSGPSPEEAAAVMAALQVVLRDEAPSAPEAPAWRWSGRRWQWPGPWAGSDPWSR